VISLRGAYLALLLTGACASSGTTFIGTETPTCAPAGPGDACTSLPPRRLPELVVQSNQIVQSGRPYRLYAIARSGLLWGEANHDGCNGDGHFTDADANLMKGWNINAVRIDLSEARWFGRRCDLATYATRIDHAIQMANAHGLYAILDLHWNDVGGRAPCDANCVRGLQPMPDSDSIEFWREVAARYGDNPGVVFDVFNEPAPTPDATWSCWRNGGCTVTAYEVTGVTYTAVGMQSLVDAVREAAPRSVVIVTGSDHGEDLSGVAQGYAITGAQLVYGVHVYGGLSSTSSDWLARFGSLGATYPVMVTELGSLDCSGDQTTRLLDYVDAPLADPAVRFGWGIRSWNMPGDCAFPSIIADWNGTPLGDQGRAVRDRLQSYGPTVSATPSP
jgi:hypothetical protein